MSSLHILREDELEDYSFVLSITLVLATPYPQGGWARYISSGRMSSGTILCSFTTMVVIREGHWVLKLISLLQLWFRYAFLMLVVTTISSGRMSSLHILGEDELENWILFSLLILCWLFPQYPQGGWARYISSVRMSSRTVLCSLYNNFMLVVTTISSGRMSSLHILREDELENYFLSSYLSIFMPGNIGMDHEQED